MNYNELKKDELIQELRNLQHARSTVDAKDQEISELHKSYKEKLERQKSNAESDKETEIKRLKSKHEQEIESLKKELKDIKELLEKRNGQLEGYIHNHGSLLKALQGVLDQGISLNDYMYTDIFKNEGGKQ